MACGNVVFVDPHAAERAGFDIVSVQRFALANDPRDYFHVRLGARPALERVRLHVVNDEGSFELALQGQDVQICGDRDLCISITLGPGLPQRLDTLVVEVPDIELTQQTRIPPTVVLGGYNLRGDAKSRNTAVQVTIDDPLRRYFLSPIPARVLGSDGTPISQHQVLLFPRRFDVQTTAGPCAAPAGGDAIGWMKADGNPFTMDAEFSTGSDPHTCVSVRPTLPEGGRAVGAVSVGGRALITSFQHVYTPIVERSPLVFDLLFDLELPNQARCSAAEDLVRSAVLDAATEIASSESGGAEVLALPPIQIANADGQLCKQSNTRSFDGAGAGRAIKDAVTTAFGPERRVRVVHIYASNLNLEMPRALSSAFQGFREQFSAANSPIQRDLMIGISAELPLRMLSPDRAIPWLATEEPAFRAAIKRLLAEIWPFKTMVHTDRTIVPMLAESDRPRFGAFRICRSTHVITPIGTKRGPMAYDVSSVGPAYTVVLRPEVLVETIAFTVPSVVVEWQGCEALCDRPSPGGDPRSSWDLQATCD